MALTLALTRTILVDWILEALWSLNGNGSVVEVSARIWERHEWDLRASGELFYTWQFDLRWALEKLGNQRRVRLSDRADRRYLEMTLLVNPEQSIGGSSDATK